MVDWIKSAYNDVEKWKESIGSGKLPRARLNSPTGSSVTILGTQLPSPTHLLLLASVCAPD